MITFKHKQTKTIGILIDNYVVFTDSKNRIVNIPKEFVIESKDWEEIIEIKESCTNEIISIKRKKDGITFSIGDTIKVDNDKAHFNHIIIGFKNEQIKDKCFTCITTKEKNGFGDELINLDIIMHIRNTGIMTKQCLCIQDYVDVLNEHDKAFLFAHTMVEYLKEKVK